MSVTLLPGVASIAFALSVSAATPPGICMAPPSAAIPNVETAQAVAVVRDLFTSYLTGPSLSVQALQARLASQVREEAKLKGCRFIVFTSVVQQSKSVTRGLMQRLAAGAVQQGAAQASYEAKSTGARVAASAAAGGAANSQLATTTQVKDTMTMEFRVETVEGATLASTTRKRKATSAGEDLLTPLVQIAAEEIAAVVSK
jgi:hypothetical protein